MGKAGGEVSERFLCIHAHFYQPPRENAWLEAVELQESAYPYHDWNERITAECYAPNSASRILDGQGRIVEIVNNYSKISFNFGPTLLSWLEVSAPEVYRAILDADRQSGKNFSGHGSAMAQPYNHMILPLSNRRDRVTQVLWGIRDFEVRFGRRPEGMWLPETAVDVETLEILAEQGIRFTLLAPHQARRVRSPRGKSWRELHGAPVDPTLAYLSELPSGRSIHLFFYDGGVSQAVAFERLLNQGENFAQRLMGGFSDARTWPQLVHIAADGETYGHHHRFGDMALAYAIRTVEAQGLARITNYSEFLERHPATHFAEINEKTSWSCVHGVGRWWSDCGCNSGRHPGWNQAWRTPLRNAFDWLREEVSGRYEAKAREFLKDPWAARDQYIDVILDRSRENVRRFLALHALRPLTEQQTITALKLLELQRYAMLMYTSCGWFFDELSGIETVQVIQYAGRVVHLAEELFSAPFEARFLDLLDQAKSNIPALGDGRRVYQRFVKPAMVDLKTVGAHYASSSLFESYAEKERLYCYSAQRENGRLLESGKARLAVGKVRLTSEITWESAVLVYGALHFGGQNLQAGVERFVSEESAQAIWREFSDTFEKGDLPAVLRLLDRFFGPSTYSLKSIFRDEQRKILSVILGSALEEVEAAYRKIYQDQAPLMRFLAGCGVAPPRAFTTAAEFVLNSQLRRAFEAQAWDLGVIHALLEDAREEGVALDAPTLEFALRRSMDRMADRWRRNPTDRPSLEDLARAVKLARSLPFEVNLWRSQNICHGVLQTVYAQMSERAGRVDQGAAEWRGSFQGLAESLLVRIETGSQ